MYTFSPKISSDAMERIETERLILREWSEDDAADVYSYASGADVGPMAGWKPHDSVDESLNVIRMFIRENETWAIEYRENHRVIGSVGLHKSSKGKLVYERELGYVLAEDYWGRGIIPEAAAAVLRYGFLKLGSGSIIASHYDFNTRSKRVIEKLGFRYLTHMDACRKRYDGALPGEEVYMLTAEEYFSGAGRNPV